MSLALAIVEDGEGAQRVIEIEVRGAPSDRAADQIARTVANSPLRENRLCRSRSNWGRILAAAGRAGVKFDWQRANIWIAGIAVCRRGRELAFDERAVHQKNALHATCPCASICGPAKALRESGRATSPRNISTSTPAIAPSNRVEAQSPPLFLHARIFALRVVLTRFVIVPPSCSEFFRVRRKQCGPKAAFPSSRLTAVGTCRKMLWSCWSARLGPQWPYSRLAAYDLDPASSASHCVLCVQGAQGALP